LLVTFAVSPVVDVTLENEGVEEKPKVSKVEGRLTFCVVEEEGEMKKGVEESIVKEEFASSELVEVVVLNVVAFVLTVLGIGVVEERVVDTLLSAIVGDVTFNSIDVVFVIISVVVFIIVVVEVSVVERAVLVVVLVN
jgi:hypothetical protein